VLGRIRLFSPNRSPGVGYPVDWRCGKLGFPSGNGAP
jgi:hypothetical protein